MANGGIKALGYVKPPFPITDFVTVCYGSEGKLYVAEIEDHRITKFYPVDAASQTVALSLPYAKKVGDPAYYCYLSPHGEVISGSFTEIAFKLYGWLTAKELNNFGKLSLAYFFQLHGYQKRLIRQITEEYRKNDDDFELLEVEWAPAKVEGEGTEQVIMTINGLIAHWESILDTYKLTWLDPLFIDGGGIYFSKYYFPVRFFTEHITEGKNILREYLALLSLGDRYNLLTENPQLSRGYFNTPIRTHISSEDEARIMDAVAVNNDLDNAALYPAASIATPDGFVQNLKDLKAKFKTRQVGQRFFEPDIQA